MKVEAEVVESASCFGRKADAFVVWRRKEIIEKKVDCLFV